jgi:hypothetical protein
VNEKALKQRVFDDTDIEEMVEDMTVQKARSSGGSKMVRVSGSKDLAKILEQMNSDGGGDDVENILIRMLTMETEHENFQMRQIKEELSALPYLKLRNIHTTENPHWNLAVECEVLTHWVGSE